MYLCQLISSERSAQSLEQDAELLRCFYSHIWTLLCLLAVFLTPQLLALFLDLGC